MIGVGGEGTGFKIPFSSLGGVLAIVMIITTVITSVRGCLEPKDIADSQFTSIGAQLTGINTHLDHIDAHLSNIDSMNSALQAEMANQKGAEEERDRLTAFEARRKALAGKH